MAKHRWIAVLLLGLATEVGAQVLYVDADAMGLVAVQAVLTNHVVAAGILGDPGDGIAGVAQHRSPCLVNHPAGVIEYLHYPAMGAFFITAREP